MNSWLTKEQAAVRAAVSVRTIERAIRSGQLLSRLLAGHKRRINRDDLDKWLKGGPA